MNTEFYRAYVDIEHANSSCWSLIDKTLYTLMGLHKNLVMKNCICGKPSYHHYEFVMEREQERKCFGM